CDHPSLSMVAMDKLLQKCKCFPSQVGKEWAQKFWKNQEKVVESIEQCQASRKIRQRKGKSVICAVLDACLSCAQQGAKETPAPKLISCMEYTAFKSEFEVADPESWDGDFWLDSDDDVEEISDSEPQSISSRPLVKTETAVDDNDEIRESEVEYVWRVSLEGGDRIMLSEEEAGGFWGPGVFLTTTPGDHNYSITAWAAYWAGGVDPQERGEPLEIRATSYSDLAVAVQRAACIQAIYERDEFRKSLMLAPVDPVRLTLLIHGLPDCLKMFVANTQDRIQAARRDGDRGRRRNPNFPIPTWNEFVQDIDKYGRRMGWISSSSIKSQDHSRRVRQIHTQNPRYPKFKERFKFNKERGELWRKALALGAPRPLLRGASMEDLRTLVRSLGKKNIPDGENCLTEKKPSP
uniref:Uncharacterized protein n=1 Tax=Anser cygnoides TaxID=8845 RepID=A0A8B9EKY0_ANSCY